MEIFRDYARRNKESVWGPFLSMLNRPDGFIVNQVSIAFTIQSFIKIIYIAPHMDDFSEVPAKENSF